MVVAAAPEAAEDDDEFPRRPFFSAAANLITGISASRATWLGGSHDPPSLCHDTAGCFGFLDLKSRSFLRIRAIGACPLAAAFSFS